MDGLRSTPPHARGPRVLVVDDNHDAADMLTLLLRAEGCDCSTAYNAEDAFAAMCDELPDVAVIDLFMPRTSGKELARRVHAAFGTHRPLLVAYTAMSSHLHDDPEAGMAFDRHLIKPATLDELMAAVHSAPVPPPVPVVPGARHRERRSL